MKKKSTRMYLILMEVIFVVSFIKKKMNRKRGRNNVSQPIKCIYVLQFQYLFSLDHMPANLKCSQALEL